MRGQRLKLVAAFAAVYLIWGSTYLGIRIALEAWPPFLMAGLRFLVAGSVLYGLARWRMRRRLDPAAPPATRPGALAWRRAAITGALLLVGGNGALTWAEQTVPSGVAALLVASEPLWIVMLTAVLPGEARPSWRSAMGLVAGFAGVLLIVNPGAARAVDPIGAVVIVLGALSWAAGSLYGRRRDGLPLALAAGMQMLAGGTLLTLLGIVTGELGRLDLAAAWGRPTLAVLYLIVFGSLIAYTAYSWLLTAASPTAVASYAYVNPLVALLLGAGLAGEPITRSIVIGGLMVVAAVAFVVTRRPARSGAAPETGSTDPVTEGRLRLLARLWSGEVPADRADAYQEYLEATGLAGYRATPGNRGLWVLRRGRGSTTEFLLLSLWEDWDAIKRFAGPEPERARYYPEDEQYLLELTPTVEHYDVV